MSKSTRYANDIALQSDQVSNTLLLSIAIWSFRKFEDVWISLQMFTDHSCGSKIMWKSTLEAECRPMSDHETEQRHVASSLKELRVRRGFRFGHVELTDHQKNPQYFTLMLVVVLMVRSWRLSPVSSIRSEWFKTDKIKKSVLQRARAVEVSST